MSIFYKICGVDFCFIHIPKTGHKGYITIPQSNKSKHLQYRKYFTDQEMILEIANFEREIMAKYDYKF